MWVALVAGGVGVVACAPPDQVDSEVGDHHGDDSVAPDPDRSLDQVAGPVAEVETRTPDGRHPSAYETERIPATAYEVEAEEPGGSSSTSLIGGDSSIECTGQQPGHYAFCSTSCPCEDGGGDCDSDAECLPGGRCMRDVGPVYGWSSTTDVCEVGCVPAEAGYIGTLDFCSAACPCDQEGHGDCDSHAECDPELRCGFDLGPEFGFDADTDVCIHPSNDLMNGHVDHCSAAYPCPEAHGDCDSDSHCQTGLECAFDAGASFGFSADTDVCLYPQDPLLNGTSNHCSLEYPCPTGHGDCDSDLECAPGTECVEDVGANYGFAIDVDVCETATIFVGFSGQVLDAHGNPVAGAKVSVNGTNGTTNGGGNFFLSTLQAERYVINTEKIGYVPLSQIHAGGGLADMTVELEEAQTFTVDPTQPVAVTDDTGTQITVPASALVDAQGNAPVGPVTMQIHTFDPVNEGMVGNMEATNDSGAPVVLESVGAVSVDFFDEAGTEFGLAPGNTAQITVQVPPEIDFEGTIPMWHYDMDAGAWVEEGTGSVVNGVATATVSHFSVWNFDIEKQDPACVRVVVSPAALPDGTGVLARVKINGDIPATRTGSYAHGLNAMYNLPYNTDIEIYIPPEATTPFQVINTGDPWGGVGVPPHPYEVCNAELFIDGDIPGVAKGFVKLGQQDSAEGTAVAVTQFGNPIATGVVDSSDQYAVVLNNGANYLLTLTRPGYLSLQVPGITVEAGQVDFQDCVQLRAGDVDGNDVVDATDEGMVQSLLGTPVAADHPADFNGDLIVDAADLQVVQGNQGMAGPLTPGDGLSGCFDNRVYESEPNEDGTPSVGGSTINGNDFSTANANGPYSASILIDASYDPVGDEDVFALENPGSSPQTVVLETFNSDQPYGVPCNYAVDTVLHIRDAAGTSLAWDDDYIGHCSRVVYTIPANGTIYVHSSDYGDDNAGGNYYLDVRFL